MIMRYKKKAAVMDNTMREEMLRAEQSERDGERCSPLLRPLQQTFQHIMAEIKCGHRHAPSRNQLHLKISSNINHCISAVNRDRQA